MADELKESSESGLMFEFYHKQGESIMTMVDGAIKAAKDSPMYKNSLP